MLETLRAYGLERLAESGSPRPRADWPGMRCRWRAGRGPDMQASAGELASAPVMRVKPREYFRQRFYIRYLQYTL